MSSLADLKHVACEAIEAYRTELNEVSHAIWSKPELCYEEHHAHDVCCNFLEKHGLAVERQYKLGTAFRAVCGEAEDGKPCVVVIAEYDALPQIGHACGHNLIAETALGAGIGIKAAMDAAGKNMGKLIVLGTPAEEGGGGKQKLLDAGVFKDISVAMMVHPWKGMTQVAIPGWLASRDINADYIGRASHAAGAPWCGVNALDAAVMAYTSISCMRQQIKPSWRVHGIIDNGGAKPNIIPEFASLKYIIRAPTRGERNELENKVRACFNAAATATGCEVHIDLPMIPNYDNVLTNSTLGSLYSANVTNLGVEIMKDESEIMKASASTDMGNVSHVVPSIHPLYGIPTEGVNHTKLFTETTGSEASQEPTIVQAKALAMTGLEVMWNPELMKQINKDFEHDLARESGSL